jgi:hypothetical protein
MQKLCLLAVCFGLSAFAGEKLLGSIVVTDGGPQTNRCTAVPFVIPPSAKITAQCDHESYVGTNVGGCDGGTCLLVAAQEKFPTSVTTVTAKCANAVGTVTTYTGSHFAMSTATVGICRVYERSGTE